jgi:hypothetical protein
MISKSIILFLISLLAVLKNGEEDVDDEEGIIRSDDPFFYKYLSTKLVYDYS